MRTATFRRAARGARRWLLALACASLPVATACAQAPMPGATGLLVPFPPGGVSDVLARALAPALSRSSGRPVVVENLSGASGSMAAGRFLAAPPDGSQILVGSPTETILAPLTLRAVRYRPNDFVLLAVVYQAPLAVYARPGLDARSVDDLPRLAARPGGRPLSYGSPGTGSLYHVATENFRRAMALDAVHVPYRGGGPLLQDLMAGIVDFTMLPQDNVLGALVASGKLKVLGVATPRRSSRYPEVATLDESPRAGRLGHPTVWVGLFAPRTMPAPTLQQVQRIVAAALADVPTQQALEAAGGGAYASTDPAGAQAFYQREIDALQTLVRNADVQPE